MPLRRPKRIPLELAPQRRIRLPRYPSHLDPRPSEVSDDSIVGAVARRFAVYALGLSLPAVSASAFAGSAKPATKVVNPFSLKNGGFPIHPIRYGTGQPSRLTEKEARPVIEKIFKRAGLTLKRDVDPKLPGVTVELDGWDAKRKIGFEYVYWNDYEYQQSYVKVSPTGLSYAELKTIDGLASAGKAYVAPINFRRYAYGRNAIWGNKAYAAKQKQIQAAKSPAERLKLESEAQALAKKLVAQGKLMALRKLEADVQQFVRWLRSQGAL